MKINDLIKNEFFNLRPVLGFNWAMFICLLGAREVGKSYSVMDFFVSQFLEKGRPFYWIRLTDKSQKALLNNNAEKLIDPDIRRRFNIETITNGNSVYMVTERTEPDEKGNTKIKSKKLMCRVFALSTFYNDKGSGLFDKDFLNDPNMYYNICFDEMNREKSEKKSFDIVYAFVNQLENLVRSTKTRLRIFMIGNTLEEASDMLCAFNFLPEKFGVFKLKKKRAVIVNMPLSERYKARRKGTVADILTPESSTFINEVKTDTALISKKPLLIPEFIIKFGKEKSSWFTVWNNNIIAPYKGEKKRAVAMYPYIDEIYIVDSVKQILLLFNNRQFRFHNLITFKRFQKELTLLKPA